MKELGAEIVPRVLKVLRELELMLGDNVRKLIEHKETRRSVKATQIRSQNWSTAERAALTSCHSQSRRQTLLPCH